MLETWDGFKALNVIWITQEEAGSLAGVKAPASWHPGFETVLASFGRISGYPKSGYLNALQHKALQSEILTTRVASVASDDSDDEPVHSSARHGRGGPPLSPTPCTSQRRAARGPPFPFRLRCGLNAVATAPICGQQIGQMAI
jgi:hypothetical protein